MPYITSYSSSWSGISVKYCVSPAVSPHCIPSCIPALDGGVVSWAIQIKTANISNTNAEDTSVKISLKWVLRNFRKEKENAEKAQQVDSQKSVSRLIVSVVH